MAASKAAFYLDNQRNAQITKTIQKENKCVFNLKMTLVPCFAVSLFACSFLTHFH